jgi:hypothetical protein
MGVVAVGGAQRPPDQGPVHHSRQPRPSIHPATWNCLQVLLACLADHPRAAAGVGFVVTASDPFCGLDLDDCLSDSGTTKLWAVRLLKQFRDCYSEITPSGSGLRIWCQATTPGGLKRELPDGGIEIYSAGRYFTFTGERFGGTPLAIVDHQADVDAIFTHFAHAAPATHASVARPAAAPDGASGGASPDDASPIHKITFGHRYGKFLAIAGALRRQGAGEETIRAAVTAYNRAQCNPPKDEFELERDLRKIWRSAERW